MGSVVAVAAIPMALLLARPHAHPDRPRHPQPDDRRKGPGIHRASPAELAELDRVTREESARLVARRAAKALAVPSTTWVNLGPTDAPKEFNYFAIAGVDSGRPNSIVVDPRDPNVVYMAVSGGGVWKSFDFQSPTGATWAPTMDNLPNLAVGALGLDPDHPDTLFVGTGDFIDGSGDTIQKSADGGGTWGDPVRLAGVSSVRQIGVQGGRVMVATDSGLFASSDAGGTFARIDLPNANGVTLQESVWSVIPIGGTAWVAAGVTACAPGAPPPFVFFGSDPDPTNCPAGNNAALWHSDDGATWTLAATPPTTGTGRTTIAVGSTASPATTAVYALVGAVGGDHTAGTWRSTDGGRTYVDATGALANPTLASNMDDSCTDLNVGHDQSWYNQAIVVDPTNPDHVLVGGNLCGMRTMNGTAASPTWELVAHWLPGTMYGETANGRLPYVHADWHTATAVVVNGQVTTFAGTDGGVFTSTDVFTPGMQAEKVTWTHHNQGLITHLFYSIASGDPTTGDPFVAYGGLQDNGTRFRNDPAHPSGFNQAIGGDGIGATVHHSTAGTTYWGSVEFGRLFCRPAEVDCSVEAPEAMDDTTLHWHSPPAAVGPAMNDEAVEERMRERAQRSGENSEPFLVHYADVETDTTGESVLSHTDSQVFVATPSMGSFVFTPISQDLTNDPAGAGIANVTASRATPGLYGAVSTASTRPFYITTAGNTMATWTATRAVFPTASGPFLTGPSSIDFPPGPEGTTQRGQVFIGAFTGVMSNNAAPPDDKGRLYRTLDGGLTWHSIAGTDPAHRIPNVPIFVAKYDPVTPTTIYVGTQIGVYVTVDDGATWDRMGDNFPMVPVRDMYIAKNQDFIRVATYGRGIWEIYPSAAASHGALGNGDYDRNLVIDWVDLGAMSARLGETPTTAVAPLYSWILDITPGTSDPPVDAIEDSDLAALLAKFGGHP